MDSRNKLRVCLIFIVFLTVVVGGIYYYYEIGQQVQPGGGTLVSIIR